jgi:hypothetical protein
LRIHTGRGDDRVLNKDAGGTLCFTHWDVAGDMVIRTGAGDDDAAFQVLLKGIEDIRYWVWPPVS